MPVIENQIGLQLDRIVVATDFKPESEIVTEYAQSLAKHYSSKLIMAHVVDLSIATRSEDALIGLPIDEMRHNSRESMDRVLRQLDEAGVNASGRILEAHHPATALIELAGQIDADMIVLGTHARRGLSKMILGSCAQEIIHHAKCPVITLGPNVKRAITRVFKIDTIVFATDLERSAVEKSAIALSFAKDNVAKIYMCHVLKHVREDFGEAIERQLSTESALNHLIPDAIYEWCSPEAIVERGEVGEHLLQLAKRVSADLIVMGAHRSAPWFSHLAEGVVGRVVAEANCPVMTICAD